jgi:hypothetical protein
LGVLSFPRGLDQADIVRKANRCTRLPLRYPPFTISPDLSLFNKHIELIELQINVSLVANHLYINVLIHALGPHPSTMSSRTASSAVPLGQRRPLAVYANAFNVTQLPVKAYEQYDGEYISALICDISCPK